MPACCCLLSKLRRSLLLICFFVIEVGQSIYEAKYDGCIKQQLSHLHPSTHLHYFLLFHFPPLDYKKEEYYLEEKV